MAPHPISAVAAKHLHGISSFYRAATVEKWLCGGDSRRRVKAFCFTNVVPQRSADGSPAGHSPARSRPSPRYRCLPTRRTALMYRRPNVGQPCHYASPSMPCANCPIWTASEGHPWSAWNTIGGAMGRYHTGDAVEGALHLEARGHALGSSAQAHAPCNGQRWDRGRPPGGERMDYDPFRKRHNRQRPSEQRPERAKAQRAKAQ